MSRFVWTGKLGTLLVVSSLVLQVAPAASASVSGERIPPYDIGYVSAGSSHTHWDAARDGQLHGSVVPSACIVYGPPFVWPCMEDVTTSTGIYVDTSTTGRIAAGAVVRGTTVVGPVEIPPQACLSLVWGDGPMDGYVEYGCAPVQLDEPTHLTTTFEDAVFNAGRYRLIVSLHGGPGAVAVDRISYEAIPT